MFEDIAGVKDCCKNEGNHRIFRYPDKIVRICAVCGCRHFEVTVDEGKLLAQVDPLG